MQIRASICKAGPGGVWSMVGVALGAVRDVGIVFVVCRNSVTLTVHVSCIPHKQPHAAPVRKAAHPSARPVLAQRGQ